MGNDVEFSIPNFAVDFTVIYFMFFFFWKIVLFLQHIFGVKYLNQIWKPKFQIRFIFDVIKFKSQNNLTYCTVVITKKMTIYVIHEISRKKSSCKKELMVRSNVYVSNRSDQNARKIRWYSFCTVTLKSRN